VEWYVIPLFIVGLALIIKGGDFFVDSSVGIANILRVPRVIIGCTIVSIATTSPELIVSATASLRAQPGVAIGNAVGSCMANIGIILALVAILRAVPIDPREFRLPALLMLGASLLLFGLTWRLTLPRWSGPLMLAIGVAYLLFDFFRHYHPGRRGPGSTASDSQADGGQASPGRPLWQHIVFFAVGLVMVAGGSWLLVEYGVKIAKVMRVPPIVIGLTMIAIGTSLPELVTAITSVRKGVSDLSAGNILGANILNVTLVTGTAATISSKPLAMTPTTQRYNLPAMLVIMLTLVVFGATGGILKRWEGVVLAVLYVSYVATLFIFFPH